MGMWRAVVNVGCLPQLFPAYLWRQKLSLKLKFIKSARIHELQGSSFLLFFSKGIADALSTHRCQGSAPQQTLDKASSSGYPRVFYYKLALKTQPACFHVPYELQAPNKLFLLLYVALVMVSYLGNKQLTKTPTQKF